MTLSQIEDNIIVIITFKYIGGRGSAYYEVAKTLNNTTNFSVPNMNGFLVGYEKRCPLTPEERLIIASLFRLPREVWIAARQIRLGMHSSIFKSLKASWSKRMEVIQWMDKWARQQPQEPVTPPAPNEEGISIVDNDFNS